MFLNDMFKLWQNSQIYNDNLNVYSCYLFAVTEVTIEATPTGPLEEGVTEAPRFIQTLQKRIDVQESTTLTIECIVTDTPTPTIMWYQVILFDTSFIEEFIILGS